MPTEAKLLLGNSPADVARQPPLPLFSAEALAFLGDLSADLLPGARGSTAPELAALGFWLRPAALRKLQARHTPEQNPVLLAPVGTVFHLPPANVATLFVYGWALSLLAGNNNIIRLSSRPNSLVERLLGQIEALLATPEHSAIRQRTSILRYAHEARITTELSALCDRRLVWGGDATVAQIRRIPLPPLAQEIVFPDRHSGCLIQADSLLKTTDPAPLVEALYRDIFAFQQQACSSPRILFWLGQNETIEAAREAFWPVFDAHAENYPQALDSADQVDKYIGLQQMAMTSDGLRIDQGTHLTRIQVRPGASARLLPDHCGRGILLEEAITELRQLSGYPGPRMQTLGTWGCPHEELLSWLRQDPMPHLDRIVPIGQALRFDAIWDGLDLFRQLTRSLYLE